MSEKRAKIQVTSPEGLNVIFEGDDAEEQFNRWQDRMSKQAQTNRKLEAVAALLNMVIGVSGSTNRETLVSEEIERMICDFKAGRK